MEFVYNESLLYAHVDLPICASVCREHRVTITYFKQWKFGCQMVDKNAKNICKVLKTFIVHLWYCVKANQARK